MSLINIKEAIRNPLQGQGKPHTFLTIICFQASQMQNTKGGQRASLEKKIMHTNFLHRPTDTRLSGREHNCVLFRNSLNAMQNGLIPG